MTSMRGQGAVSGSSEETCQKKSEEYERSLLPEADHAYGRLGKVINLGAARSEIQDCCQMPLV